jgi:hypothetical protein
MADALERHSDLAYVLSNNTFSFSGKSFIQILNYTYLIKQRKVPILTYLGLRFAIPVIAQQDLPQRQL